MRTIEEVNQKLDRLYARQYDLECVCLYEMDQQEYQRHQTAIDKLFEQIVELEYQQNCLLLGKDD